MIERKGTPFGGMATGFGNDDCFLWKVGGERIGDSEIYGRAWRVEPFVRVSVGL